MFRPPPRQSRVSLAARPPRKVILAPVVLESRAVPSVTALTLSASPGILRPISPANQPHAVTVQHVLPVTLAGEVTDPQRVPSLRYQVVDSYGRYQPGGTITDLGVAGDGRIFYNIRIGLSELRNHRLPGGRRYTVVVTAQDVDGTRQAATVVTVPPAGFFHRAAQPRTTHESV